MRIQSSYGIKYHEKFCCIKNGFQEKIAKKRLMRTTRVQTVSNASTVDGNDPPRDKNYQLPPCVAYISTPKHDVYIIGTVHAGGKSSEEVTEVIRAIQPDVVMLELDQERLHYLLEGSNPQVATEQTNSGDSGSWDEISRWNENFLENTAKVTMSAFYESSNLISSKFSGAMEGRGSKDDDTEAGVSGGEEFVAAAVEAERVGALVVLGDARVRDLTAELGVRLKKALFSPLGMLSSWKSVWRHLAVIWHAGEERSAVMTARGVDMGKVLMDDPGKLAPVAVAFSLATGITLLLIAGGALLDQLGGAVSPGDVGSVGSSLHLDSGSSLLLELVTLPFTLTAFAVALEVLLISRDRVLSESTLRALDVTSRLRENETTGENAGENEGALERVRYTFSTSQEETSAIRRQRDSAAVAFNSRSERDASTSSINGKDVSNGRMRAEGDEAEEDDTGENLLDLPVFTLKRPMKMGTTRVLNLFEPRLLALMDDLAARQPTGSLVGARLACLQAGNRWYGPTSFVHQVAGQTVEEEKQTAGTFSRTADLVLPYEGFLARVIKTEEDTRAVTGARKIRVWIEPEQNIYRERAAFRQNVAGYLEANFSRTQSTSTAHEPRTETTGLKEEHSSHAPIKCVCVVGLAHCNGMVSRIKGRFAEDGAE